MPRAKDPGSIKTGSGKTALSPTDRLVLLITGMPGAPPNIGQPGYYPPDATTPVLGFPASSDDSGATGLVTHVDDPVDAHDASAIGLASDSKVLFSNNVQGAVDEFASGVATPPPMLGQSFSHMGFTSMPDWGALKLRDQIHERSASVNEYPYYHTYPSPTSDWTPSWANYGNDPQTDPVWNGGDVTGINGLPGTGLGLAKAGAFTVSGLAPQVIKRTRALALQISGVNLVVPAVVSGSIFPADRGVLALIHWPAEVPGDPFAATVSAFLLQTSRDRVVAAIVLGSGAADGGGNDCITKLSVPPVTCDGSAGAGKTSTNTGSIFSVGLAANGSYDPFAYPGQAGGQYDLHEINTGFSDATAEQLPGVGAFPWWGDGWKRAMGSTVTGAGQVRWGTDPTADPDQNVVTDWGIPVLGAGPDAYAAATGGPVTVKDPFGVTITYAGTWGSTIITSSNFFRYRLPYMKDYTAETGLKYTPRGLDAKTTRETKRYFDTAALSDGTITRAGNYANFAEDHWNWQVARYRHSFYIPGSDVAGAARELGTYWMIHFKTERDFEAFVRDGHMPWDLSPNGYEVYGVSMVDTSGIEAYGNRVNEHGAALDGGPGTGPAPAYGYGSKAYHALRTSIITADNTTFPTVNGAHNTFTWALNVHTIMYVSGVAYFLPVNAVGAWGFGLSNIDLAIDNPWLHFYRTDDNALTGTAPPARLSSPCPMFMGIAPFAYETLLTAGADIDDAVFGHLAPRPQRLEVPFEFLGTNGSGAFAETNGPLNADQIVAPSLGVHGVRFPGDVNTPAFTENALPRVFVRRPLAATPIQPVNALNGNGIAMVPTNEAGAKILFHSTKWNLADTTAGHYGNFIMGAAPSMVYPDLVNATKDTEERFLDETYRYILQFDGAVATNAIAGPGMKGWFFGSIPAPVRIGRNTTAWAAPFGVAVSWQNKSFAQSQKYLTGLAGGELQVAGLPTRNPAWPNTVEDAPLVPFPSSGLLIYPQKNYSLAYAPNQVTEGGVFAQPDYSAFNGVRSFIRTFDASFSASFPEWDASAAGQPFVVFHIDGLTLDDFRYVAAGPGGLGDGVAAASYTGIAIMVKVPGLTTWMDIGRLDGDGPSKQDAALDGAGCQVAGPNTFSSIDSRTGMVYCQVKVNVGPDVNLANGEDELGTGRPMVPVMVKVVMNELAKDYNLEGTYTGFPGQFDGVASPGAWAHNVRGLSSIKVVFRTRVETAPAP